MRQAADALVDTGLAALGYDTLMISDCWASTKRQANGTLLPDPARFPNGLIPTIDYVHAKNVRVH